MAAASLNSPITLANGIDMPALGLGVWNMAEGSETEGAVTEALKCGYRLIDTAAYYRNEASVGRAARHYIENTAAPRNEIFVTTKLWPSDFDGSERAFMRSLEKLDLEYIDLYLIHWPSASMSQSVWKTLERMKEEKLARAIGVSNYEISDIERLLAYANVPPAVNQIKFSVFDHDLELLNYCKEKHIVVEAYSPLEHGHVDHSVIQNIAETHNKTPAQIMLRWCLEHGTIPIPKSSNPARIRENADVFDFALSGKEMSELDALG